MKTLGPTITQALFGLDVEARGVEDTGASSVGVVLASHAGTVLRYPGGTPTENAFDLANPDRPNPTGIFDGKATVLTPLSRFLEHAAALDAGVAIVLPTARYFDATNATGRPSWSSRPRTANPGVLTASAAMSSSPLPKSRQSPDSGADSPISIWSGVAHGAATPENQMPCSSSPTRTNAKQVPVES